MKITNLIEGNGYYHRKNGKINYAIFTGQIIPKNGEEQARAVMHDMDGNTIELNGGTMMPVARLHTKKYWHDLAREIPKMSGIARDKWSQQIKLQTYDRRFFSHYCGTKDEISLYTKLELWTIAQLEKHQIAWDFETRHFSFADGTAFFPDFYLPKHDLFLEMTCSPRKAKVQQVIRLNKQYPKIRLAIIARRDLHRDGEKIVGYDRDEFLAYLLPRIEPRSAQMRK